MRKIAIGIVATAVSFFATVGIVAAQTATPTASPTNQASPTATPYTAPSAPPSTGMAQ
jgi:hypothetical protein